MAKYRPFYSPKGDGKISACITQASCRVIFFQISSIKSCRKVLTLQCLQHIRIPSDYLHNCIWSFSTRRPLFELMVLSTDKQNGFPNQVTYLKGFQFYFLVVSSSNSNFVFLNFFQSLQPIVGNFINVVYHQVMIINNG
jgi:hypothetical protein